MAFCSVIELISDARKRRYALGYFESFNLESVQGVLDAAEETCSPIILGFSGDFLSGRQRLETERLELYADLGRAAAVSAKVPCALIFNECPEDSWVKRACDVGFNLVMPANPAAPPDEYEKWVRSIVAYARARDVAVEAELGTLPCGASGVVKNVSPMTDPASARAFVQNTGVDLLAVSVGNIHIQVNGERRELDLQRLEEIAVAASIPLSLHGGSGISNESIKAAISLGVAKVNYGTYIKQKYLRAIRKALASSEVNPHELLGMGGAPDVMLAGRAAVRDAVLERIEFLGCCGKAK